MVAFFFCHNKSRAESDSPCDARAKITQRSVSVSVGRRTKARTDRRRTTSTRPRRAQPRYCVRARAHRVEPSLANEIPNTARDRRLHGRGRRRTRARFVGGGSTKNPKSSKRVEGISTSRASGDDEPTPKHGRATITISSQSYVPSCGRSPRAPWSCTVHCTPRSHPSARRSTAPTPCRWR